MTDVAPASGGTLVMGVLNVTPDSFSDGGRWCDHEAAVARGREMVDEGADVVDVGGESTRPGADPVDPDEEAARVLAVVEALAPEVRVSIDTRHPSVAEAAVAAGATLVNDVSATLWPVVAAAGPAVGWVAMHMRGDPRSMQSQTRYDDVVDEVMAFLVGRATEARAAGVGEVWIDPGIGFAKEARHNMVLLGRLDELVATGIPVLVGASRKRFLGAIAGGESPDDRLEASLAVAVWSAHRGARMVRVHDVGATVQAMRVVHDPVAG